MIPLMQSPTDHLLTRLLAKAFGLNAGSRLLDIGCGSGYSGIALSEYFGCTVDFVDVSQSRVNEVSVAAAAKNISNQCKTFHSTAEEYVETCNETYDFVIAHGGLLSLTGPSLIETISKKCLTANGIVHASMLTLRRVPYKQLGGCDVPQHVPEEVTEQYRNTVLSSTTRWLPFEDEAVTAIEHAIGSCWASRSSGLVWSEYYANMYSAAPSSTGLAEDDTFCRSTAIDEAYYKLIGQKYIDYTSLVASRSPLSGLL
ncbi:methyltransferase domain-containing protein [Sulfitobacter sp. M39]|uniref:SAM-dependent methyltransferase n=1 Tax=Sulfitobacter sp. M39 TaxID=2675334 RepID=UPI001F2A6C19|nr:class I SAM-dependent methyltransferase [Sulfitobacter sp. M39]MCF7748870.1 methyltransferase domain-containing protein [Sulfitobacter sp. M39]